MDKLVVKELIQNECTPEKIRTEIELIIQNQEYAESMRNNYNELAEILGGGGASRKVAQSLLTSIHKQ